MAVHFGLRAAGGSRFFPRKRASSISTGEPSKAMSRQSDSRRATTPRGLPPGHRMERSFPRYRMRLSRVSPGGRSSPVWRPNGRALFYHSGNKMMALAVETEGDLVLGRPAVLF